MVSFWIDYGTNYIGGTGSGQSEAAWRIPLALQLAPAIILGCGILFMPFSPEMADQPRTRRGSSYGSQQSPSTSQGRRTCAHRVPVSMLPIYCYRVALKEFGVTVK